MEANTPFARSILPWRNLIAEIVFVGMLGVSSGFALAASLEQVSNFGANPGNLAMFKYVPDNLPQPTPLVVALHGCQQQAADYDDETGWTQYAERDGFALLLPQQLQSNNPSKCFNWFEPDDIRRGFGEALSIKQMVDKMQLDHNIDAERIYVTGLSAGGYMATVMLATYPDVFAGGGIVAGGPYRCATSVAEAFSCMNPGKELTASAWGQLVRDASDYSGPWPTISFWHGDADNTVKLKNMAENVEQWTEVHGTDQIPDLADSVRGYEHRVYQANGVPVVETYTIAGMGHGTPVDPGTAEIQCGIAAPFILDVNICSTYYMGRFWGLIAEAATLPDGGNGGTNGDGRFCGEDTNANHATAGRATSFFGWLYFAKGSWNWMGFGGDTLTTLQEQEGSVFNVVSSCSQ